MSLRRSIPTTVAILMALASGGVAQAQMPPCASEFVPLRDQVQKDSLRVKAAIEKKDRAEICNELKRFVVIEAKFVKYMADNQSWCGIPADAVAQMTKNHQHTLKLRGQACNAAAAAGKPSVPAGPGLSDALGTSRAPTPSTIKPGYGALDTLTGTPFKQ
jgi:hypothetical protein